MLNKSYKDLLGRNSRLISRNSSGIFGSSRNSIKQHYHHLLDWTNTNCNQICDLANNDLYNRGQL